MNTPKFKSEQNLQMIDTNEVIQKIVEMCQNGEFEFKEYKYVKYENQNSNKPTITFRKKQNHIKNTQNDSEITV